MKKFLTCGLALVLCVMMILPMAACGPKVEKFEGDFVFECFNFPMRGGSWPYSRRTTEKLPYPRRLTHPSVELKIAAAAWMYECGKYMLEQYGLSAE